MGIVSKQVSTLVDVGLGLLVDARYAGADSHEGAGLILTGRLLTQGIYMRLPLERESKKGMHFSYIETVHDAGVVGAEYLASRPQS
ncbi:hypothetical protein BJY00DRAFT_153759 [Aspergillus carlsbadensis]|nr:hypothetical protein BJY00DRAFT_153759 [Aspergillus carlsbadensis]